MNRRAIDNGGSSAFRLPRWLGIVAFVALVFAVYHPVWHASFIWDDDAHLTAHRCIVGPLGFREIWTTVEANYFPLVLSTFWVLNKLFGLNPVVFHLTGIFFHAITSVLLWSVLRRLKIPGAGAVAAIWVLHPVQAESVAWISEIVNTQSGLLFVAAIWFYITDTRTNGDQYPPGFGRYLLCFICAVGALLSKPSTVGLPIVLGLCTWWRTGRIERHDLYRILPIALLAISVSGWTIWEQKFHSGAVGAEWNHPVSERLAIAGWSFWYYLGKLFWPAQLTFVYPKWDVTMLGGLAYLPATVAFAAGYLTWRSRKTAVGRALILVGGFYVVMIFPVLGFFDVYYFRFSYVADHFQYLASIGPIALVVAALDFVMPSVRLSLRSPACAFLLMIGSLAILTSRHALEFCSSQSLWEATLAKNPRCFLAWNNLGVIALDEGRIADAADRLRRAVELNPLGPELHFNFGKSLVRQNKKEEAAAEFRKAIALKEDLEPAYVELANELAGSAATRKEAIDLYTKALSLKPDDADAHANLALALANMPDGLVEGIAHAETSVRLNSKSATSHMNLGLLLARDASRLSEAIRRYQEAIALDPKYVKAHINLGLAYAANGAIADAVHEYEIALHLDPESSIAHNDLAVVLAGEGRTGEAIVHLRAAIRSDPSYIEAQRNLSILEDQIRATK